MLSPGGSDAHIVREFDLRKRAWVEGAQGFEVLTPYKTRAAYRVRMFSKVSFMSSVEAGFTDPTRRITFFLVPRRAVDRI